MPYYVHKCSNKCFDDMHQWYTVELIGLDPKRNNTYESPEFIELSQSGEVIARFKNETVKNLVGNFDVWLSDILRGPTIKIPVEGGRLIKDRSTWKIDDLVVTVQVKKIVEIGALVIASLTEGLIPAEFIPRSNGRFEWKVNDLIECIVVANNGDRVIVKPFGKNPLVKEIKGYPLL